MPTPESVPLKTRVFGPQTDRRSADHTASLFLNLWSDLCLEHLNESRGRVGLPASSSSSPSAPVVALCRRTAHKRDTAEKNWDFIRHYKLQRDAEG